VQITDTQISLLFQQEWTLLQSVPRVGDREYIVRNSWLKHNTGIIALLFLLFMDPTIVLPTDIQTMVRIGAHIVEMQIDCLMHRLLRAIISLIQSS